MTKQPQERITGLLEEEPISFYPSAAEAFGVNEAIVLQQISFYMNINKKKHSQRHFKNGRWWVFNTYKQWCDDHFPWLSERGLQGVILGLEKLGVLLSMQGVENPRDRRKWYSVDRKKVAELVQNATQKRAMHDAKSALSHDAKSVRSETQNLYDENTESTSEITTENTEKIYERANAAHASDLHSQVADYDKAQRDANDFRAKTGRQDRSVEGNQAQAPESTSEQSHNRAKVTTTPPPSGAQPPAPSETGEASKKSRTPKQLERDMAMNALAEAMGVTLVKADEKRYSQIAAQLVGSGITYAEFDQYVKRIRIKAKEQNGWEVTVDSLVAKGRPSEYVTAREKWRQNQAKQGQGEARGDGQVLSTMPLQNNAANRVYNPRLDPAYANQTQQESQS